MVGSVWSPASGPTNGHRARGRQGHPRSASGPVARFAAFPRVAPPPKTSGTGFAPRSRPTRRLGRRLSAARQWRDPGRCRNVPDAHASCRARIADREQSAEQRPHLRDDDSVRRRRVFARFPASRIRELLARNGRRRRGRQTRELGSQPCARRRSTSPPTAGSRRLARTVALAGRLLAPRPRNGIHAAHGSTSYRLRQVRGGLPGGGRRVCRAGPVARGGPRDAGQPRWRGRHDGRRGRGRAGAHWGVQEIPTRWLDVLHQRERLERVAAQIVAARR